MKSILISDRLSFLFKDSAIYGGADISARLLNIILIPIIVRAFNVSEYAVIDSLKIFFELTLQLALLGTNQSAARLMFQTDNMQERKNIVGKALILTIPPTIILCFGLWVFASQILSSYFSWFRVDFLQAFQLMLITVPFAVLFAYSQMLMKWNFHRNRFILLSVGLSALTLLLTIIMVTQTNLGIPGLFLAQLIATMIFCFIGATFSHKYITLSFKGASVTSIYKFGVPLAINGSITSLVSIFERALIIRIVDIDSAGLYGLGKRIAALINIPSGGFNVAWGPFSYSIYRKIDADITFRAVAKWYVGIMSLLALSISLASGWIVPIIGSDKYLGTIPLLTPLIFAFTAHGFVQIAGLGILLSKKTYLSLICTVIEISTFLVGSYILTIYFGIVGIAFAFLIGKLSLISSSIFFAYRVFPLRLKLFVPIVLYLSALFIAVGLSFSGG